MRCEAVNRRGQVGRSKLRSYQLGPFGSLLWRVSRETLKSDSWVSRGPRKAIYNHFQPSSTTEPVMCTYMGDVIVINYVLGKLKRLVGRSKRLTTGRGIRNPNRDHDGRVVWAWV